MTRPDQLAAELMSFSWSAAFHFSRIIARTVLVIFVVSFFGGAVLIGHATKALALVGGGPISGYIIGLGGVREMFPLFAGAIVASRTGADFSSQVALFTISHQIDALEVMGFSKRTFVALPRIIASTAATPLLVVFSSLAGILGAYGIGIAVYHLNPGDFWAALWFYVTPYDFWVGLLKGTLFGGAIGVVSTGIGFLAKGGAQGIKACVNKAIVYSMIAGSLMNLLCTFLFYGQDTF